MKILTPKFGRYYEDFEPGVVIEHRPGKTITEGDNNLFCLLTMNHHPVHLNRDYAADAHHGMILVVGTLVFSLVVGMSVRDVSGLAIVNLEYSEIKHVAPVFLGDTIYARTTVEKKRLSKSDSTRGIVWVETIGYKLSPITHVFADEPMMETEVVLTLKRTIAVPRSIGV